MNPETFIDPSLTSHDRLVLDRLLDDIARAEVVELKKKNGRTNTLSSESRRGLDSGYESQASNHSDQNESQEENEIRKRITQNPDADDEDVDASTIRQLTAMNNPKDLDFNPTVFVTWDLATLKANLPHFIYTSLLQPYIQWARTIVRNQNDVVMVTHLILYATTSVPSAIYLFHNFTWIHGILHWIMQGYYLGTYTLMMHQHIHMRGILAPAYSYLDTAFPFITDPLMGHTWRSYYYHHVKHHHIEGNGPDDMSSTLRYQRDDVYDFAKYVARFFFLVWFDLFSYFIRKGKTVLAFKACAFELGYYVSLYLLTLVTENPRATLCVFLLPLFVVRLGLMAGNWGQHAFVDDVDPDSDFRSSITLIDVASNRFCFNDGYHTSHHLNPLRHWRDHPVAFLSAKTRYASEGALTFRNIDYLMLTYRLLRKDYKYLARCLVPMGEQMVMTLEEREALLRRKTRKFTEVEIQRHFGAKVGN